jgi:hypothetical protein
MRGEMSKKSYTKPRLFELTDLALFKKFVIAAINAYKSGQVAPFIFRRNISETPP